MSQRQIICGCYYEHSDGKTPGHIISCPLHAAAPILLEALEAVVEAEFGFGAWPEESVLRAAIAQAKGETANG